MNVFLDIYQRELTSMRRARLQMAAIHMYLGDPAVLRERLKAATTPQQCDEIFEAWAQEAMPPEVPK